MSKLSALGAHSDFSKCIFDRHVRYIFCIPKHLNIHIYTLNTIPNMKFTFKKSCLVHFHNLITLKKIIIINYNNENKYDIVNISKFSKPYLNCFLSCFFNLYHNIFLINIYKNFSKIIRTSKFPIYTTIIISYLCMRFK